MGIESYLFSSVIEFCCHKIPKWKRNTGWRIFRMHFLARCRDGHLPDADGVVAVAGEQGLAVGRPGERQALWWVGLGVLWDDLWAQFFDWFLARQILLKWMVGDKEMLH